MQHRSASSCRALDELFAVLGLRAEGDVPHVGGRVLRVLFWYGVAVVLAVRGECSVASAQPWRCLWRRLSQITMTRPLRRITLHFSQIFLTLG